MDQGSQEPPKRGTQPLKAPNSTRHFSDAFVSSAGQSAVPVRGTRPLQMPSTEQLKVVVPQRIEEITRELNYVRHLTVLFSVPVTVLRYALYLAEHPLTGHLDQPAAPNGPAAVDSALDDWIGAEPPAQSADAGPQYEVPEAFQLLSFSQRDLAQSSAKLIMTNAKLKQRVQVALFQYDETIRSYEETSAALEEVYACSFEEAWDRLNEMGIERLKGKAYAICGFYDNFKTDGALSQIFPPPNQGAKPGSGPLVGNGGKTAPLVQPIVQVQPVLPVQPAAQDTASQAAGGLLGKVKGLFNRG